MKWKELHKIAITGSRKFSPIHLVNIYLEEKVIRKYDSTEELVFITGGALGVDSTVETMCSRLGIKWLTIPGRWLELEKAAGPHRNKHIVDLSNEVIGFWDEESSGTKQCIDYAQSINKPCTVLTGAALRKLVGHKVPYGLGKTIVVPAKTSNRTAHKLRELIDSADLSDFFNQAKEVTGGKKRKPTAKDYWGLE